MIVSSTELNPSQLNPLSLKSHIEAAKHYEFIMDMMRKTPATAMYMGFKIPDKAINFRSIQLEKPSSRLTPVQVKTAFDFIWKPALFENRQRFEPYRQKALDAGFDLAKVFAEIDSNPEFRQTPEDSKQKSFMDTIAARINRTVRKHENAPITEKSPDQHWMAHYPGFAEKYKRLEMWSASLGENPDRNEMMLLWILSTYVLQEVNAISRAAHVECRDENGRPFTFNYQAFRDAKKPLFLKPMIKNWRALVPNPEQAKADFISKGKEALKDHVQAAKQAFKAHGVTDDKTLGKITAAVVKGIKSEMKKEVKEP